MKRIASLLIIIVFATSSVAAQQAAYRLAQRILGKQAKNFVFRLEKDSGDVFALYMNNGSICVEGSSEIALCMGLNYYLKEYARVDVSWYANQPVQMPENFPRVKEPVLYRCEVPVRFFLNYCTYGYTMVWWKWPEWERFIDWMALNGINMPLALTGQESVWQEVWKEMGMSDDEIRAYFSGPAHLPWHRMANLDGFGGPLPQSWIDGQRDLQRKIVARERELGMTPILPAFAGHVPRQIAERNPQADIKQLNGWCGFEPTYFLNSTDSLFAVIQKSFLSKQTKLYGSNHVYGIDPFNEMDPPSWDTAYLASVSRNIYSSLQQVDPKARWLQMSWVFYYKRKQWTPERLKAYLTAVPKGKMILLDYFCEKTEVWRETEAFYGQPFIWCYLGNFGGNTMLVGDIKTLDNLMSKALRQQPGNMIGIGSTLESFDPSPHPFAFVFEYPWQFGVLGNHTAYFTRRWADLRQGYLNLDQKGYALPASLSASPDHTWQRAWRLLVDSVYRDWSFYGLGTQMVARPSLSGHGTYYTKPYYSYDNATLLRAIQLLMETPSQRASFQYDVANLLSQWLGNHFMEVRDAYTDAYRRGDTLLMHRYARMALDLMDDADTLLCGVAPFNCANWVQAARSWGSNKREQDYYETQARTLLTVWGGPVLNDYANRMWGNLIKPYYRGRWSRFFQVVDSSVVAGVPFDQSRFNKSLSAFEHDWSQCLVGKTAKPSKVDTQSQVERIMQKIKDGAYTVPNRARQVLTDYMNRFPEAQLQDVYKFCFQDIYGPGHIIKDSASCANYILSEMEQMAPGRFPYPDYEYAGIEGNYVRVNIKLIKDGKLELGRFVQLLMSSAKQDNPMPLYDWRGQWQRLQTILNNVHPRPNNFESDAQRLQQMFDRGEYVFHHSTRFNQAYAPHYRLIRRDLFEQEILPLLKQ